MTGLVKFAADHLGIDLYPGQKRVLEEWAASGKRKAVFCLGRRSGKGLMAAVAAISNAVAIDYSDRLRPGEQRFIVVVATRQEQAREFIRVCRELLQQAPDPDLAALVDFGASTSDEIVFRNGVTIRAMPCSSRSTRGLAISLLVMDEAAHMSTAEDGFAAGRQVYNALVPSTAQFGDRGYVLLTSTPNWRSGIFFDVYRAATEGVAEDTFIAEGPTWQLNLGITRESLESEFRSDPDMAEREYAAKFSSAAGAYLDPVDVFACVRKQSGTLPPQPSITYSGAIDPAFERDQFCLGICHKVGDSVIVDGCWTWRKAGFERTLDEVAQVAAQYRITTLKTDQYSAAAVVEGLQRRRVSCQTVAWDNSNKYQAFGRLKAALNTRQIELPDDEALLHELMNLEARPTATGLTRIAAATGHDDRATVLAALVDSLEAPSDLPLMWWPGQSLNYDPRAEVARLRREREEAEAQAAAEGWF